MSAQLGAPLERVDGRDKVTGTALYAAEAPMDNLVHAVIVQSTIAKGHIKKISTDAAERSAGVLAVITHRNRPALKSLNPDKLSGASLGEDRLPLADNQIYYNGQHIAVVVAESFEEAQYAAALITVDYERQASVLHVDQARLTKPQESSGDSIQIHQGDVEAGLRQGAVKIEQTYTTPIETHNPMEPSATVASWRGNELTVYDATQWVEGVRKTLATVFGLAEKNVQVRDPFVGGGFGCKGFQWPHILLSALSAKKVGRPVRLVLTRAQMFTSVGHRSVTEQRLALSANKSGQLTAMRHATRCESSPVGTFIEKAGVGATSVMYACKNIDITHKLARVNIATPTAMRAPGETPGTYALESAMDELAYALDMDPIELRLKNHANKHPTNNKPFSSKHLKECYRLGADKFGWHKINRKPRSMRDGDLLVGWGMATATYPGHRSKASVRARLLEDGSAVVGCATQDLGTGSYTIFTQVAAEALGLPTERVRFELGDTTLPPGPVSGGSQSAASVGPAVAEAAQAVKAELIKLATSNHKSPLAGLEEGQIDAENGRLFSKSERGRGETYGAILRRSGRRALEAEAHAEPGDERQHYAFQSFGAQFVEVKIDPVIARLHVSRALGVFDAGRILNAKTARSQFEGGMIMGIGMALFEHTVYDPRSGHPMNDNLAEYLVPTNPDINQVETHFLNHPDPYINTLGCRGIGEIGITGMAAAVANAVYHATGKRIRELPITPDKLL